MRRQLFSLGQKLFTGIGLLQTLFVVAFMAMLAGYYTFAYRATSEPQTILAQFSTKCDVDKIKPYNSCEEIKDPSVCYSHGGSGCDWTGDPYSGHCFCARDLPATPTPIPGKANIICSVNGDGSIHFENKGQEGGEVIVSAKFCQSGRDSQSQCEADDRVLRCQNSGTKQISSGTLQPGQSANVGVVQIACGIWQVDSSECGGSAHDCNWDNGVCAPPTATPVPPTSTPTPTRRPTPTPTRAPTPTPTVTVTPTMTSTPTPTLALVPTNTPAPQRGKFKTCKFNDQNKNGQRDSGDEGLQWSFQYRVNGGSWADYRTQVDWWRFWLERGCGDLIELNDGDTVNVHEFDMDGWDHTTSTNQQVQIQAGQIKVLNFGNVPRVGPTSTPTSTPNPSNTPTPTFTPSPTKPLVLGAAAPTIAPKAGTPSSLTFGLIQIGVIGILLRMALLLI